MPRFVRWCVLLTAVFIAAGSDTGRLRGAPPAAGREQVEFNRDIRLLLSDNCYQCHGPDAAKRQADLRLDLETGALADLGGRHAIVPGKPEESELYLRLMANDPAERMPPEKSARKLTPSQIELVRRWIEQGASWQQHWSFIPPRRPTVPTVRQTEWVRTPIDAFVLARLEQQELKPAPDADLTTLFRRASFDLTGLPPTPEDVDALLADPSPDAYERAVDRLLASPRFGERMAVRWLDGARYADTNGYQSDGERFMWRWRDWVIDAYNRNLPFDQFTVEQLAGDLLPGATLDQQIASGFNRNHRGNAEGGIIPEEYAVEYVVDRVETTFTVWMGLTMGCGRCHDHKFDPLTQREFYQAFAYFNSVPEFGRAVKYGNSPPVIKAPTREQSRQLELLDARLATARDEWRQLAPQLRAAQSAWEQTLTKSNDTDWSISRGLVLHAPLDRAGGGSSSDAAGAGELRHAAGKMRDAAEFDGTGFFNAGDVAAFGFYDKFTLSAWILPRGTSGGTIISRMTDAEQGDGYSLRLVDGKLQLNLVKRWLDDALRVETEQPLVPEQWHHVLATYDGSRVAGGVRLYVDGKRQTPHVLLDLLNQTFATKEPVRIGGGYGPQGRFHGLIDEVRLFDVALTEEEAQILATDKTPAEIAALPADRRTLGEAGKLQSLFVERHTPEALRQQNVKLFELERERERLLESFPTTMIMQELPAPRPAHILLRGEYDKPGELVSRDVPACLPRPSSDLPRDRLGFARWLVSPQHPLTARVTVNRLWQMLFGIGIVKTVDDFGAQGEWPSHPELLDWLAVEFSSPAKGPAWDTKRILKLLVTSSVYRQASRVTPELLQRDPENRLLARGPRLRLSAEMVRDQALYAGGLLVEHVGGPSVKPYQPAGLWKELADTEYDQDQGDKLYRRGMYTYWKRTVPPPTMITFDSAGRETCIVRETRTNTPLQALALMNDVTFVEASRALAQRVMREVPGSPAERLTRGFRLALSRPPRVAELAVLTSGWKNQHERFARSPETVRQLLEQGALPQDPQLDSAELAAYTVMAGVILNLDEAITKE